MNAYLSHGRPVGTQTLYDPRRLARGMLVAFRDALWRVVSVEERPDMERPWAVVIRPAHMPLDWTAMTEDIHLGASRHATFHRYDDAEHHPVCAACKGPWPCHHLKAEQQADREIAQAERYAIPGVCPACSEPVSTRQLRQTWPVNLYAIDRDQPVTFHLRRPCGAEARSYDEAIRKAGYSSQLGYPSTERTDQP